MRVLFIVPWPEQSGPFRFRVGQYLPFLKQHGIEYDIRPFMSREFFDIVYKNGQFISKTAHFAVSCFRRLMDTICVSRYDLLFIQREAFPYGPALLERLLSLWRRPMVFDFDDAIYLPAAHSPNRKLAWLKCPSKTATNTRLASLVIAGNAVLEQYARRFNSNVLVLPTPVDTDEIVPCGTRTQKNKVNIGWTGSPSTVAYLHSLDQVFQKLSCRYPIQVEVYGGDYHCEGVDTRCCCEWTRSGELDALKRFDIGVMPLPDDEWTRGKCGFKILEYMAAGIPAVASPVGANNDIIISGETGFLPSSTEEWVECLGTLIESATQREAMGAKGRSIAVEKYSVKANAPRFLKAIQDYS